jgi:hypothetical protein
MRIPKLTQLLLLSFILLGLPDCGHIPIPVSIADAPLWFIKGDPLVDTSFPQYAVLMNFLTSGTTDLTKAQMDLTMHTTPGGWVLMKASSWESFNTEIGKLCTQDKCDFATLQRLQALVDRMKSSYTRD